MIAVIDSGVANITSVLAALERLQVPSVATADPAIIKTASHVILPGVGTAAAAMRELKNKKLVETIQGLTQPVLGICLGMQLLFDFSEEGASSKEEKDFIPCLSMIPGTVRKMTGSTDQPLPHMGWNRISFSPTPLLNNVENGAFMYFVHSFAAPVSDVTLASCSYAQDFTAICTYKNFFGCQFHPERSGKDGQTILHNFLMM